MVVRRALSVGLAASLYGVSLGALGVAAGPEGGLATLVGFAIGVPATLGSYVLEPGYSSRGMNDSGYPYIPWVEISRPASSSSSETRNPIVALSAAKTA